MDIIVLIMVGIAVVIGVVIFFAVRYVYKESRDLVREKREEEKAKRAETIQTQNHPKVLKKSLLSVVLVAVIVGLLVIILIMDDRQVSLKDDLNSCIEEKTSLEKKVTCEENLLSEANDSIREAKYFEGESYAEINEALENLDEVACSSCGVYCR